MIAKDRFVSCFGIVPPGDTEAMIRVVTGAVKEGFAIVPLSPGGKIPLCTLTSRQAASADKAARLAAKEAGHPRWDRMTHDCGLSHALTDPTKSRTVMRRLIETHGAVNIGIELGASRMVAVDVDSPAELGAFLREWSTHTGQDETTRSLTVSSPGSAVTNPDGSVTWIHHGGGHFWFSIPDGVELPAGTGVMKAETGWVAMWSAHQVLVPPSKRPEGTYKIIGQTEPLPSWLADRIIMEAESRAARARIRFDAATDHGGTDIDQWATRTPWDELLVPDGWINTGLVDTCSCPIWTAPGLHASPKSATAHDLGCSRYGTEWGHAPLHVWTDNPPEYLWGLSKTITKLTYVAARSYGGNQGDAIRGLGLNISIDPGWMGDVLALDVPDVIIDDPVENLDPMESMFSDPSSPLTDQVPEPREASPSEDLFAEPSSVDHPDGGATGVSPVRDGAPEASTRVDYVLPEGFWQARETLSRIRQAAHSRTRSGDVALYAVLSRLAAMTSPHVRVDTGVAQPASLNVFVAFVDGSGAGKSSGIPVARDLLPAPDGLIGSSFHDGLPIGSGEGLAEAYMGWEEEPAGETPSGKPKVRKVRRMVRHHALFYTDEGESLCRMLERAGATIGPALRSAWVGETIGQSNAKEETTRVIPAGSYSMGLMIGFQPSTVGPLLKDAGAGTPQRFLFSTVADPYIPEDPVEWPGRLLDVRYTVGLAGLEHLMLSLPTVVRAEIRAASLARARGQAGPGSDPLDSHAILHRVKVAGLLGLLEGRDVLTEEDWELAGVVWDTSCAVRGALVRAERDAVVAAARAKEDAAVRTAVRSRVASEEAAARVLDEQVVAVAQWIRTKVSAPVPRGELRKGLKSTRRRWFDDGLEEALSQGWVTVGEVDGVTVVAPSATVGSATGW